MRPVRLAGMQAPSAIRLVNNSIPLVTFAKGSVALIDVAEGSKVFGKRKRRDD